MSDNLKSPSLHSSHKFPSHRPFTRSLGETSRPQLSLQASRKTLSSQYPPIHVSPKHLSDKDLYSKCQEYGGNAKLWLRKFAGLLPEVLRRSLHRKHGCGSIHEFAKKLSGMNERTVNKILNLHERLIDKPHLLDLFESGEQGWSKLEAVAFIATSETEKDFAEKVATLPQKALYIWVKNFRDKLTVDGQSRLNHNLLNLQPAAPIASNQGDFSVQLPAAIIDNAEPASYNTSLIPQDLHPFHRPYTENFTTFSFHISTSALQKLHIIKRDLEKEYHKTLTWNEVIKLWPAKNQKIIIKKVCPACIAKRHQALDLPVNSLKHQPPTNRPAPSLSRHIPEPIKNLILATHGQTCAFPGCYKAFTEFHHVEPFAIYKSHDLAHIYPVCSTHHTLFHAGLIANSEKLPAFWCIRNEAVQNSIDKKVMNYKMKS